MKIKVLGAHNTESLTTRHTCLLIDGVLALDAGGLTSALSFEEQLGLKGVFLTHGHYDHIRDIPALAMNLFLRNTAVDLYTHQPVADMLTRYFLNGDLYPEFHRRPENNPTLRIHILQPGEIIQAEGYRVRALSIGHSVPAVGYQIEAADGKTLFYTGDTGVDLSGLWKQIDPQVLFIEVTASNQWAEYAKKVGHLVPVLLKEELAGFREIKGYLPQVFAVHVNPANEIEIGPELEAVARSLGASISLAQEGMTFTL